MIDYIKQRLRIDYDMFIRVCVNKSSPYPLIPFSVRRFLSSPTVVSPLSPPRFCAMSSYNSLSTGTQQSPYGSGDPYYNESTGYITPHPVKKNGVSNWLKIGVPVLVVVVVGAVLGGVLGSRKANSDASSSSSAGGADASSVVSVKNEIGRYATATNSLYLVPLYPSTVSAGTNGALPC